MAQYEITVDEEIMQQALSGEDEALQQLWKQMLNQMLEAQRTEVLQAEHGERTKTRQGYRNGYYERNLTTRVGTIELQVPRVRSGEFSTELFERYQRSEKALVLALMEMVVNGVSTRRVKKITQELCGTLFSKSTVSRLCKQLDPMVKQWNQRPLDEHSYPFVIVDGLVLRIREDGRVRQKSALLALGVNEEGYRELLGLQLGNSETYEGWASFFDWLKDRGLSGVDVVVSDDHRGLKKAVHEAFQQETLWQRCQYHFTRNILDKCQEKHADELKQRLRDVLRASSPGLARQRKQKLVEEFIDKTPDALDVLENGFEDAIAVLHLPSKYRQRLRTTNALERLNEEIRRRDKVIRIYPNDASAHRLVGALLMEQHEEWLTGRRYFDMTEYQEWKKRRTESKEATPERAA